MKRILLIFYTVMSTAVYPLTVYDPANYAVNLDTKLNTLQQIDNQIRSLENEARSLVNQAKNLQQFDLSLSMGSIQDLRNNLQKIIRLQNNTKSTINDYVNLQDKFEDLYPNYSDDNFQTASDYSRQAEKLSEELNSVTYDTMKALEITTPEKYNNDTERIDAIMDTAKDAEGQLQAIQAAGQISAHTSQQIMELKYLTGQSLKLQSSYIASQNQKDILVQQQQDSALENNVSVDGADSGFINSNWTPIRSFE